MLDITIKTIPNKKQRYPTLGDYWIDEKDKRKILVSNIDNENYEFLIAIHELVEQHLCKIRDIKEKEITKFDINFEKRNSNNNKEPGDDLDAPYYKEHQFATIIERLCCQEMGLDWISYENYQHNNKKI